MKKQDIIIITSTIAIGLLVIVVTLSKYNLGKVSKTSFQARLNTYSLNVYSSDLNELFKISPFDDFYYKGYTKNHLVERNSYKREVRFSEKLQSLLPGFLKPNNIITWSVSNKKDIYLTYQVTSDQNQILITRTFEKLEPSVYAVGQSFIICKDCYIVDQYKKVYLSQSQVNDDKIKKANSAQFTPVIISQNLIPSNISKLIIFDSNFNPKYSISINSSQQVFYDEKWNLLELKTFINQERPTKVSQVITIIK